jgi:hypothetical protein
MGLEYNEVIHHPSPAMTASTDTDLREVLTALAKLTEGVAALSQRVEVGFVQSDAKMDRQFAELRGDMNEKFAQVEAKMDIKFAQVDTKLSDLRGEMNQKFAQVDTKFAHVDTKLAKIGGDIALLRQPRDFGDFVKRAIVSGMAVTVFGGLLLAAGKLLLFGTV